MARHMNSVPAEDYTWTMLCKHRAIDEGVVKNNSCHYSGVVAVCARHQGLVAVAFAPVFSEKQCSLALHIIAWGAGNWVY